MSWPVEEIRIAESDVLGSRRHLLTNVFHHDLGLDHSKLALIHRNHWTMPAQMLAAAARLCVARAFRGPVHANLRILSKRRQRRTEGSQELQPVERNQTLTLRTTGKRYESRFKLAAQNCLHAQRAQV